MGQRVASLEIGLEMATSGAIADIARFGGVVDATAIGALKAAQTIDTAMANVSGMPGATASAVKFAQETERSAVSAVRDYKRIENAAEGMVRSIEREISVYGKTSAEIRNMRVEMRAADAESRGMVELATRLRTANVEINRMEGSTLDLDTAVKRSRGSMAQLSYQVNDVATMAAGGADASQIFATQAGQVLQIAQQAEGGVKGFAKEIGALALRFAPALVAVAALTAGMGLLVRWVNDGVTNDQLTGDLGKITGGADATKEQLYQLRDATVTWGDVSKAVFSEVGKDVAKQFVDDIDGMSRSVKGLLDDLTSYGRIAMAGLYAGVAGTRSYLGELEKGGISGIAKVVMGQDPDLLKRTYGAAYDLADKYLTDLGQRVKRASIENARTRLAESIGFNTPRTPRADHSGERAAREGEAIEAQIRNLYALADAYGVSAAAALIAEARVKAESKAIRQRGDIEVAVAREVRLIVAQRVADAAKGTATLIQQAAIQEQINADVAEGNTHAALAGELVRNRIADGPLLAAIEAARAVNDVKGFEAAEKALDDQRAARDRLTDADRKGHLLTAMAGGADKLAELAEELRLIGATEDVRVRALATLRATQEAEANGWTGARGAEYVKQQVEIAAETLKLAQAQREVNAEYERFAEMADRMNDLARSLETSFGKVGGAIGDAINVLGQYGERQADIARQVKLQQKTEAEGARATADLQLNSMIGLAGAARGFFKEHSAGYNAMMAAEKALTIVQLARTAIDVAGGAARMFASLGPLAFPAVAAMLGVMASLGFSGGGKGGALPQANDGSGTTLGDKAAGSESIIRSIDALRAVDTVTSVYAREAAVSLRSIENQIGGLAAVLVRAGAINADAGVNAGFKTDLTGKLASRAVDPFGILSKIPVIGGLFDAAKGLIGSLFGTKTTVKAGGLYAGAQSIEDIIGGGFDAKTYSDVEKRKKFLGLTTSTKTSTVYGAGIDDGITDQFGLILKSFNDAIVAAAGPLGASTADIADKVGGFVFTLGKVDLKDLTGEEIQERLTAIFGAAADDMANAAFPGIERFQRVGEGAFATLTRVASTVEAVTMSLDQLGLAARGLTIDARLGIADQFDSVGAMSEAAAAYFETYYSAAEQTAARAAQLGKVFASMGIGTPASLNAYRALVEAQDLSTAAGQATYATLLQLAPAFADLQAAMMGAKSAAAVMTERQDLERDLLELRGDTAALRALDLAKLDASNRALQTQVWAVQDAMKAAEAAETLRDAWKSVGDTIMDEVRRIRGLTETGGGSFATLMAQFNAATAGARGGDMDLAKTLPGLSQAVLKAAADAATSRQELDRVQASTAASLEATYGAIGSLMGRATAPDPISAAATVAQAAQAPAANDGAAAEIRALRDELAAMRADHLSALSSIAGSVGRTDRRLEAVTGQSGGEAISITPMAA